MATNRLFIYDPETNSATCIAKGYSNGWSTSGDSNYQNGFYDNALESTGEIDQTRFQLKIEKELPKDTKIYWPE